MKTKNAVDIEYCYDLEKSNIHLLAHNPVFKKICFLKSLFMSNNIFCFNICTLIITAKVTKHRIIQYNNSAENNYSLLVITGNTLKIKFLLAYLFLLQRSRRE